jgi:putative hydrolase
MSTRTIDTSATSTTLGDVNAQAAGLLRDMAQAQTSTQKAFGYKRAARTIFHLETPLTDHVVGNALLTKIPSVGPASARIILELINGGVSPTVERAIDDSGRRADIDRRRQTRGHVLSRAAVLQVLHDPTLAPFVGTYRGDLQMHSEWSDGYPTLAEIIAASIERRYEYAAVTDHSYGLKIAGGLSMEEAASQHAAIDHLNGMHATGFRLLKGIEANIGADGQLDLSEEERRSFEVVLAAPHSKLRSADDQTERFLTAVTIPHVHILAHPRGRIAGSRSGVVVDWDPVFAAAAAHNVAIEIDGDPARQDLDYALARQALNSGCLFALDSDAHTTDQFQYVETAMAHAALAGIPPDRVINYWDRERLLNWLAAR